MLDNDRIIAFDSNVLAYFLDGNRGSYAMSATDPLADQRIAAVRLFLYGTTFIPPTVRTEAEAILNPQKYEEHIRFINYTFAEIVPDGPQVRWIENRTQELLPHHTTGLNDCRIVAEVEQDGAIPVLVTFDGGLKRDLEPHACIRIQTPVECCAGFDIPRGTRSKWVPAPGHPLANETWWRW